MIKQITITQPADLMPLKEAAFLSSFHDEKFNCWYLNRVLKIKHRIRLPAYEPIGRNHPCNLN